MFSIILTEFIMSEQPKSKAAIANKKRRDWLKENDPEKYEAEKLASRARSAAIQKKKREKWDTGTKSALKDKEEWMEHKR